MVDVGVLPGFIAVIWLFLLPPGPDMAYVTAAGLQGGSRSAVKAILGIGTGMSLYAAAVVIGVGEIAQSHPSLLDAVKLCGAAYLLWLAYVTIRSAHDPVSGPDGTSVRRPYLRGVVVSAANPKVLLFFLAVLPQFVGEAQNVRLQLAMLGAVNVATEVLLYGAIGMVAGIFHGHFSRSGKARATMNRIAGTVYVVLAVVVGVEVLAG